MSNLIQFVAIATSVLLLAGVLELVRRRKLTEEYSFIWLTCALALLILSVWRDSLHLAARLLDVYYPPALLLLVLIFFVFVASLYFSVVVSRQRQQIERLMEEIALLDAEVRELREGADGGSHEGSHGGSHEGSHEGSHSGSHVGSHSGSHKGL